MARLRKTVCLLAILATAALVRAAATRAGEPSTAPQVNAAAFAGLGRLAFVQQGLLFVLDGDTGTLTLIDASGAAAYPEWSPDGEWLAYLETISPLSRDGQLWIARADGTAAHAVADIPVPVGRFAWSPSADLLAVAISRPILDPGGAWVVQPDGAGREVSPEPIESLAWSPDGSQIAMSVDARPSDRIETFSLADSTTTLRYMAPTPPDTGVQLLGWTPDGSSLLFGLVAQHSASLVADGVAVSVLPLAGGPPLPLVTALVYDDWRSFSSDGQVVALVAGSYRTVYSGKRVTLCELSDGSCTPLPMPAGAVSLDPAWAPDGSRLALVEAPDLGSIGGFTSAAERDAWVSAHRLLTVNPAGNAPLQLSPPDQGADAPIWSRDGGSVLYLCGVQRAVCLVPSDGSETAIQVVNAVSGAPSPLDSSLGFYGHVDPARVLAWWQHD